MNARYYLPEVGRFISPDTLVPDPGNPQSHNRYAYVLNSPVNYTDPSGHREIGADENDLLPNQPPPTISEQLAQGYNVYGITFAADEGQEWTSDQMAAALSGVAAVDRQLRITGQLSGYIPGAAFRQTYGSIIFRRSAEEPGYGGYTKSGSLIVFYPKAFTVALFPKFRNNVVHELGHAFNAAMVNNPGGKVDPYLELGTALGDGGALSAFGARAGMQSYPWRQAVIDMDTNGEIFADYYLNWTYGSFLNNGAGQAQSTWMNQHIYRWLSP